MSSGAPRSFPDHTDAGSGSSSSRRDLAMSSRRSIPPTTRRAPKRPSGGPRGRCGMRALAPTTTLAAATVAATLVASAVVGAAAVPAGRPGPALTDAAPSTAWDGVGDSPPPRFEPHLAMPPSALLSRRDGGAGVAGAGSEADGVAERDVVTLHFDGPGFSGGGVEAEVASAASFSLSPAPTSESPSSSSSSAAPAGPSALAEGGGASAALRQHAAQVAAPGTPQGEKQTSEASDEARRNTTLGVFNAQKVSDVDYYNPNNRTGGSMLTIIPGPTTVGLGEPVNVIVSGKSSPSVLTVEGFLLWATSIHFGVSCLGQANGTQQMTNLGDGYGNRTQGNGNGDNGVLRWNYYDPYLGTCKETFQGGNHFRWWIQNGTLADSGAFFLAASVELPLSTNHMIAQDGYNRGRDELVGNATLPNGTEWMGNVYNTTLEWIEAGVLLNATSEGINHPSVALPGQPTQDGRVALLTVTQLKSNDGTNAAPASSRISSPPVATSLLAVLLTALAATFAL